MLIQRTLDLKDLLSKKSFFLFGPRATGKSTLIKQFFSEQSMIIDLLNSRLYLRLLDSPHDLESIIDSGKKGQVIVIDEIQRIPELLNEVHRLIENRKLTFLLTGSSARKIRRGKANLLAGRVWEARLFPLTWKEIPDFDLNKYYRRYCESLLAVDENLGRIMDWVENNDNEENTIVIYMGDNGFQFGEHGLIDKRTAYEASIKVPLLIWSPGGDAEKKVIKEAVANIDIAPTLLDFAGISIPGDMDGESFKPLIDGEDVEWRKELLYEYYWERNYPYTPTTHALITDRYKFIRYQGIWDLDEFYDMQEDPNETRNLINDKNYQELIKQHRIRMFELLKETNGNTIPLLPDKGNTFILRNPKKSKPAPFPESFYQE